jgi:hypothetical protein
VSDRFELFCSGIEVSPDEFPELREFWDAGAAAERDRLSQPAIAEDGSQFCEVCGADLLTDLAGDQP